jgi:hypothetical protein
MLAAALTVPLLAAGCSKGFGALGTPPTPAPEVAVLTGAIAAERALIARYQAVLGRLPTLAATMNPLLAEHHAHLAALTARLVPGAARPSPTPTASQAPPAVPGSTTAATAGLGAAEQAAAGRLLGHLVQVSPPLAQLLASIAASEATHAAVLGVRVSPS